MSKYKYHDSMNPLACTPQFPSFKAMCSIHKLCISIDLILFILSSAFKEEQKKMIWSTMQLLKSMITIVLLPCS